MSSRPKRRAAAKAIDYSKEQEFSDDDVFGDEINDEPAPRAPPSRARKSTGGGSARRPRKSLDPGFGADYMADAWQAPGAAGGGGGAGAGGPAQPPRQLYVEKGYDPSLPPIRERFTFEPELEEDGSPKIDLIVGRRPIDERAPEKDMDDNGSDGDDDDDEEEEEAGGRGKRRTRGAASGEKKSSSSSPGKHHGHSKRIDYEYLIKYKGRSYLHLEWKSSSDLESMNKSAKNIYRRYIKKIQSGTGDEDIEDPEFDQEYIRPEKIVDEKEEEVMEELTDKDLVVWEKQREKEMEEDNEDSDEEKSPDKDAAMTNGSATGGVKADGTEAEANTLPEDFEIGEPGTVSIDELRMVINKGGSYYPKVEGSDNPYRDGYVTEPPKKPRASYLFFQCAYRGAYGKKHPDLTVKDLQKLMGDAWNGLGEEGQAPFAQLAQEELAQYEHEKALLEKAQKASEVWQPIRRCEMVLNRIAEDSFADIFLEPVDLDDFPDYEEIVEDPMDLSTIRKKLQEKAWAKRYQAPENFARDMRKVFNNCKIYNQHGSAIWHVADYLSKQFERLYHAWVLEFRTRYLRWADPRARPWENTCRKCDGKYDHPSDKTVLCDHCDAHYGISCLSPPLADVPHTWHCPDCAPKLVGEKGSRMLSAVSEMAAKRRAELGDIPKKPVLKKLFLVKWAGLGYEQCTWETAEDIDDDELIAEYRRLNGMTPDDPELLTADIKKVLDGMTTHVMPENAGGKDIIPDLRAQLYSQTRALQFCKFGSDVPDLLAAVCGPKTKCSSKQFQDSAVVDEVASVITGIVDKIAHYQPRASHAVQLHETLPPLLCGEYDVLVPITPEGLLMNVGEMDGAVSFLGYRRMANGDMGPSERKRLIRSTNDQIIAVNGVPTINKPFKEVIPLLKAAGSHTFAHIRFLDAQYRLCNGDLTSVGVKGAFAIDEITKKIKSSRRRLIAARRDELVEEEEIPDIAEESDESVGEPGSDDSDSSSDSDSDESEGSFEPDSDDEELIKKQQRKKAESPETKTSNASPAKSAVKKEGNDAEGGAEGDAQNEKREGPPAHLSINCKQETTKSLAYRLLGVDVGYSSDEGGDDDCAHYIDGVDSTFSTRREVSAVASGEDADDGEEKKTEESLPVKRSEFTTLGERAKLVLAMSVVDDEADPLDYDNYPHPSTKQLEAKRKLEEEEARKKREAELAKEAALKQAEEEAAKPVKLSTTKVEQVDTRTNEVVRVWAKVEDAAATLQLSLEDLRSILQGEYSEETGDEVGGYRWRFAAADAEVTNSATGPGSKKGKQAFLEFRDKLYDHAKPHIYKNKNKLRDYQIDGVNWLSSCWYKRHSCILADEMGLGKTVQIVTYLEHLYRVEKLKGPFLVVVPLSTVEHWRREFQGWTDMRCCVYHDRQRVWRDVMREYEWYYADRPHTADYLKFDVIVTTYDTLIGDFDVMGQIPWRVAVVDEAHRLRNIKGKLLECMKEISAVGTLEYGYQSRVLMTGTPLQNNTQELWTLLNFIEPFKFPSLEEFEANFGDMNNRAQVEALQHKISPYMLRRVKEDVAKDIPAKEETLIDVELTQIQKQYYRAIFEHNHSFLSMGAGRNAAPKLMNIQMELRKCCNHPFLLDGVETREMENYHRELYESGAFEGKSADEVQDELNMHGYIQTSGKMVLLDKLLPKLLNEGHKVLIFSQMVKMLDLLSEYMDFRGFRHETLTGKVKGNDRQKAIDRFNTEKDSFAFLLSTRAGGVGINLTAADICIIFDSDWNPQNDVQAQARCHRIGQTKDVRIYRLITSRTFEQEMFDRASKKLGLEQAVLGTFGAEDDDGKPTAKEMEQLLKKGAYALVDDDDEIGKEFCADDIESILAKRTRTRVVEGAKTASWLNKAGMNVTKSKFTGDSKSAGIDVDDPLFWQKVMPDFVTPDIMMEKLNELTDAVDGRKRGPGRGRGRKKKASPEEDSTKDAAAEAEGEGKAENGETEEAAEETEDNDMVLDEPSQEKEEQDDADEEEEEPEEDEEEEKAKKKKLSQATRKKVNKFMGDLTSLMDDIFEREEDDNLPQGEKATCQKLLLTISVKESLFTEEQRNVAKMLLKRLEGDRRRRCRTTEDHRFLASTIGGDSGTKDVIPEALMIRGTKKKRRKRRKSDDDGEDDGDDDDDVVETQKRKRKKKPVVGADGYLQHSDSEGDWSDVGDSIYHSTKNLISRKEAKRRRGWASEKDAMGAASRAWPSLPRNFVNKVLGSVLDEMIKYDETKGGLFSTPVPRDEYPEYYEQVKEPMDYSTMKTKLANGEYRSAQAMQKDFLLVMKNCIQFNSPDSDIVAEAKQQMLIRPKMLMDAADKHNLFIAEDGTVFDLHDDEKGGGKTDKKKSSKGKKAAKGKKKRFVRCKECDACKREDCGECEGCLTMAKFGGDGKTKSSCKNRKCENPQERPPKDDDDEDEKPKKKKGRKGRASAAAAADATGSDSEQSGGESAAAASSSKKKPRIKISAPKSRKRKSRGDGADATVHLDAKALQKDRQALDDSYDAAKVHYTNRGPWKLPDNLADKFDVIAKQVLVKMDKHDEYDLFAEAVTEEEAPGYQDVVANPIDFGTMLTKVEDGAYGEGSDAAAALYEDFLLCMENCAAYNDMEGEVMQEATRLFGLIPETFAAACTAAGKSKKGRKK